MVPNTTRLLRHQQNRFFSLIIDSYKSLYIQNSILWHPQRISSLTDEIRSLFSNRWSIVTNNKLAHSQSRLIGRLPLIYIKPQHSIFRKVELIYPVEAKSPCNTMEEERNSSKFIICWTYLGMLLACTNYLLPGANKGDIHIHVFFKYILFEEQARISEYE